MNIRDHIDLSFESECIEKSGDVLIMTDTPTYTVEEVERALEFERAAHRATATMLRKALRRLAPSPEEHKAVMDLFGNEVWPVDMKIIDAES